MTRWTQRKKGEKIEEEKHRKRDKAKGRKNDAGRREERKQVCF